LNAFAAISVCFLLFLSLGCNKEDLDKMVADAKEKASSLKESANQAIEQTKQKVESAADLDGNGTIQLDSETKFSSSFVRLIPADGARPAILQLKSHKDGQDKLPSFFIQGEANASSLDELAGKTVPCQVFAQKSSEGTVWSNLDSDPILVSIERSGKSMTANFRGELIDARSGSQISTSGNLESVEF
jgi:hypothetical protein